jgi:transposase-like protein
MISMKFMPNLWRIAIIVTLLVTSVYQGEAMFVWDERLTPAGRVRQRYNPRRNRERKVRRWVRRQRRQSRVSRAVRSRKRKDALRLLLSTQASGSLVKPYGPYRPISGQPKRKERSRFPKKEADRKPEKSRLAAPLADLRQQRGWIDRMDEAELWEMLRRVRWSHGPVCPHCGEQEEQYLDCFDPDYRNGLGRWRCQVCAEAGDPGDGGTFTPLTGTLLNGARLDARTLWLLVELFADSQASVRAAKEARVNRHTADRLFRLLRASIYQTRSPEAIALAPTDIAEFDEVYITAGLKGQAGGLKLEREARKRGLKRRGRGNWESDRLPVFGLLCRGGEVRLFVLRNVQTDTIRPIVQQMVQRGARVYTDGYSIYHFLSREGYQHQVVNHSAGEYARDLDGDGHCEVHCNTMESTWSWLRPMVRTYRGVSKVYLPLYVAQFEFFFNRRHHNHWNRTLDVLQTVFSVEGSQVAELLAKVEGAELAQVCPVTG